MQFFRERFWTNVERTSFFDLS